MILDTAVKLQDKTLTSAFLVGTSIVVSCRQVESGPPVYEITATAGQSVETQRHTFGNADGTGPMPTALQAFVDSARQTVADAAAWDEHVRITPVV